MGSSLAEVSEIVQKLAPIIPEYDFANNAQ
jgi:hypothetical protein